MHNLGVFKGVLCETGWYLYADVENFVEKRKKDCIFKVSQLCFSGLLSIQYL